VASVSVHADPTITRRKPRRSAKPGRMNGAEIAIAIVVEVIVRPLQRRAPKVRVSSGSSGCVEYRFQKRRSPARTTGARQPFALRYIVAHETAPTLTLSAVAVVASLGNPARAIGRRQGLHRRARHRRTDRAPIENATIVVRDGKIVAVGPAARVTVPAGAERCR